MVVVVVVVVVLFVEEKAFPSLSKLNKNFHLLQQVAFSRFLLFYLLSLNYSYCYSILLCSMVTLDWMCLWCLIRVSVWHWHIKLGIYGTSIHKTWYIWQWRMRLHFLCELEFIIIIFNNFHFLKLISVSLYLCQYCIWCSCLCYLLGLYLYYK